MNQEILKKMKSPPEVAVNSIRRVISQYKESFEAWFPEEMYKWRAVQCFQEHWNPESEDFAEMLQDSLAQANNLLDTNYAYSSKMIVYFAQQEPGTVRSMFQRLLVPEANVIEQIQNFKQSADVLLARHQLKESMKQHYQGDRTICAYLFFVQPVGIFCINTVNSRLFWQRLACTPPVKWEISRMYLPTRRLPTKFSPVFGRTASC